MNETTPKFRSLGMAVMGLMALLPASPAMTTENIPVVPSCQLYTGDASIEALQKHSILLKEQLLHSVSSGDHCQLANIHYKLAQLLPDKQVQHLDSCIDHSRSAITRDSHAGVAYFFKGLCLGRLGETRGIWGSLKIIEPIRESMEIAARINPAIDRGGPHRALGRLYFKLPMILGGNIKKSIDHLLKALVYGPMYWENHFFLAESYFKNQQYLLARTELQRAMEITSHMKADPENPTRKVEFQGLMQAIERNIH